MTNEIFYVLVVWEGVDALEDYESDGTVPIMTKTTDVTNISPIKSNTTAKQRPKKLSVAVSLPPQPRLQTLSDESDDAGSADDYITEDEETKSSSKTKGKVSDLIA